MESQWTARASIVGAMLVVASIATSASPAPAAPSPAARCLAAKTLAAGAEASAALTCAKKALASGTDPACVASAAARRDAAFVRAARRGGCAQTGDSAAIGLEVASLYDAVLAALRPGGPGASRCTTAQLAATARTIAKIARAYARDDQKPDPVRLAAALATAAAQLDAAFGRAAARGDCLSAATATDVRTLVETATARLRSTLAPSCGDGLRSGAEICDGADAASCPTGCTSECTCNAQCGNGTVEAGEQCDGSTCPGSLPTQYGCFAAATENECQCCATTGPCYVRGFGNETPVETACCSGAACNVPGPEAGDDAIGHCSDVPPATCPCWTAASIDAAFPPGYFSDAGRGGGTCDATTVFGVATADTCLFPRPASPPLTIPRAGVGVLSLGSCALWQDVDSGDTGFCGGVPSFVGVTSPEAAACVAEIQASVAYQSACP